MSTDDNGVVVITGSIYIVGEAMDLLARGSDQRRRRPDQSGER